MTALAASLAVIIFGLLSSTALNMVVVPILYARFHRPTERTGRGHQRHRQQRTGCDERHAEPIEP